MQFPARFSREPGSGTFNISFPDIPEALTCGQGEEEAMRYALDALETALDFYFEDGRPIPTPSPRKRGQRMIALPASTAATVMLHNELLHQNVRPAELAKRLGIPRQEITRMLNLRHKTKIDTIAAAFIALGKRLELRVA
jgi:antitoxin HicB